MKKFICILLSGLLIFGLVGCGNSKEDRAYKEAQDIVIARAKYPDTIKFNDKDKSVIDKGHGSYTVYGSASSQNGFGATVHLDFTIDLLEDSKEQGKFNIQNVNITQN